MRLQNTPPAGAGKSQGISKTDRLLRVIEGLGQDKGSFLPQGIRTADLAERAGVARASVAALLAPHVASGRLQMCKVSTPGLPAQNEYRKGAGVAVPDFVPLKAKRGPGSPFAARNGGPTAATVVPVSTPGAGIDDIVTPTFIPQTQPEVVAPSFAKTPAADVAPPIATAPAVAAKATPKPQAGAALKKEPAAPKASAGDVFRINLEDDGTLILADEEVTMELDIGRVLRLGDFLHATTGVWRP